MYTIHIHNTHIYFSACVYVYVYVWNKHTYVHKFVFFIPINCDIDLGCHYVFYKHDWNSPKK